MGLAGPGRQRLRRPSAELHSWELPGLSRADRVIRFAESLPCTAGQWAGTKFRLRPWQKNEIRKIYREDKRGTRPVRTVCWSMGRGNGKTGLAAVLALCHLVGPEARKRSEVYAAANDRFQASRIFNEIAAIVRDVPWLSERVVIRRFTKELEDVAGDRTTGSFFQALSADVPSKHGLAPSFIVYDEFGQATSRDLLDTLETAMGKRPNPMLWVISTQAARDEMPLSGMIDYGLRVQRGEIEDPSFHLVFHTAPADADPWKPSTWKLANPGLGDILSLEHVERLALQAQRMPAAEASFRNLVLNQRVDTRVQFLSATAWAACRDPLDRLEGRTCFAALDLGATRDMSALVLVFPDDRGAFDVLPFCWLPGATLQEREDEDRVPYRVWAKAGQLLTFEGRSTDPHAIALKIAELHGLYTIQALAFDRWRIADIERELDAVGCEVELVPFGQGFKDMAPAVDVLERLVDTGMIRHGGHPLLTMAASNARVEMDAARNRKLSKKRSTGRIDLLVALTMALGIASRHEQQEPWTPMLEVV
jgi:phage terminase large subunit-like protein